MCCLRTVTGFVFVIIIFLVEVIFCYFNAGYLINWVLFSCLRPLLTFLAISFEICFLLVRAWLCVQVAVLDVMFLSSGNSSF